VQWENRHFWVPAIFKRFVAEVLWVGSNDDKGDDCWIEVGEYLENRSPILDIRSYYWAENDSNTYTEHRLFKPDRPPIGAFQEYTIDYVENQYRVYIGGSWVGTSAQPGRTFGAETGLEASDPRARTIGAVDFREFKYRPWGDTQWYYWGNLSQHQDPPAYWNWSWPTASNGIH